MAADLKSIDPQKLYSISEIAPLVPSPHRGEKGMTRATIYKWIKEYGLPCSRRQIGRTAYLFVWGRDVLEFLGAIELPEIKTRSAKQRARDMELAEKRARELGIL